MRYREAKLIAKLSIVMCPLCEWTTPFKRGSKTQINARVKKHLRQEHPQEAVLLVYDSKYPRVEE